MLIIDMPKKYLTDASGFVSCEMCEKYLPLLHRDCHKDFKGCLIKGELPDEHGDLIDRTLLCADLIGVILSHSGLNFSEVIARQNAVIKAERKDDGTTVD